MTRGVGRAAKWATGRDALLPVVPLRGGEPWSTRHFKSIVVEQVGGLTPEEAERAIEATLETLPERITGGEALYMAAFLPFWPTDGTRLRYPRAASLPPGSS